jgi:hypothetical protein
LEPKWFIYSRNMTLKRFCEYRLNHRVNYWIIDWIIES